MCTIVVEVPDRPAAAVRLLAVRDEDPGRAWDPPGRWWPDAHPGIVGVRDRRANGAWLAADPAAGRLAVILNRAGVAGHDRPEGPNGLASRGSLVLDAVTGAALPDPPRTASFNLLSISGEGVVATGWDGERLRQEVLAPGVHMLAHHEVDDADRTARIAAWLPEFRALAGLGENWRSEWTRLLSRSARLAPSDDRAIIRDNRAHGYPTLSLLACLAEVGPDSVRLDTAVLPTPARWKDRPFERSI